MFGFLIGFLCLALLIGVLRGSRRGCGGGRRGRGHGWHGGGGWRAGRGGPGPFLGFVFDRLQTTPAQEREIRTAVEALFEKAGDLRREGDLILVERSARPAAARQGRTALSIVAAVVIAAAMG